jgi:hypothetical protein
MLVCLDSERISVRKVLSIINNKELNSLICQSYNNITKFLKFTCLFGSLFINMLLPLTMVSWEEIEKKKRKNVATVAIWRNQYFFVNNRKITTETGEQGDSGGRKTRKVRNNLQERANMLERRLLSSFHFRFPLKKSRKRKWLFSVKFGKRNFSEFVFNDKWTYENSISAKNDFPDLF